MPDEPREKPRDGLLEAFRATRLTLDQVWSRFLALGGDAAALDLAAYMSGLSVLSDHEHNILARAINDRLDTMPPPPYAPYRPAIETG